MNPFFGNGKFMNTNIISNTIRNQANVNRIQQAMIMQFNLQIQQKVLTDYEIKMRRMLEKEQEKVMKKKIENPYTMKTLQMQKKIEEEKRQEKIYQEKIESYYKNNLYEIDFRRIKQQIKDFNDIKNKLEIIIKNLEECINYNNKIINDYSKEPLNKEIYINLINLSSSIEDIYENKSKELKRYIIEMNDIYKLGMKELKDNYLNEFNKKYKTKLSDKNNYLGFRNTEILNLGKIDEATFKDLCRINFNYIKELELKFEDNIDISPLKNFSYHDLNYLGLIGKIKNINILSQLPFKSLQTLFLSGNDFSSNYIDIFENISFNDLKRLILIGNQISNIKGLSKVKFYNLTELNLQTNLISDLSSIELFPFTKLEKLDLDNNLIFNIDYLSNANFPLLKTLILSNNKISNINVLSKVKFNKLISLILKDNKIENIDILSSVPFINLSMLDLGNNLIKNINVLGNIPFKINDLKINNNPITDYRILYNTRTINSIAIINVDRQQHASIQNIGYSLGFIINNIRLCE